MQKREDDVDLAEDPGARGPEHGELAASQRGGERPLPQSVSGDLYRRPAVAQLESGRVVLDEHPPALGRDAHREDLIAVSVNGRQDSGGGGAGDRVLTATATEDDGDTHLGLVRTGNGGAGFLKICHRSQRYRAGPRMLLTHRDTGIKRAPRTPREVRQ